MTLLTRWFRSGIEEQRRLAAAVGKPLAGDAETFRRREQEEQEAGEACNYALYADEQEEHKDPDKAPPPPPPQPPQSAWELPVGTAAASTVASLTGAGAVAFLFNTQTVNGSTLVLLLVPASLVAMKLSGIAHKVGRIHELRALSENADRRRGFAFVATFLAAVGWGVARSIPKMGDTVTGLVSGGMWLLELCLGWAAAESAALWLIHSRAPRHFGLSREFQRLANATESITAVVGEGSPSSNGAGSARRSRDRGVPTGVTGLIIGSLLLAPVMDAHARTGGVFVDRTKSVYQPELLAVLPQVADKLSQAAAQCTIEVTVRLVEFDGSALSLRVAAKSWTLDSLKADNCDSRWKARCAFLREAALKNFADQRAPKLASMKQWLRNAGTIPVAKGRGTCVGAQYAVAQLLDFALVVTDGVSSNCQADEEPTARPGRHMLIIAVASAGDGDQAQKRLDARIAHMRAGGFWVVDASQLDTINWSELVSGGGGRAQ